MLRVIEHYSSIQGEGPNTGLMTQFLRFAGCNMRCAGWPCDTPQAIDPKIWRTEAKKLTIAHILDEIEELPGKNICLTGGEPFMQPASDLSALVWNLTETPQYDGYTVEVFTNGSYVFPGWTSHANIMMDWKLKGSGEADTERSTRFANAVRLKATDGIKFVVKDEADLKEAMLTSVLLETHNSRAQLWVGAAWDCISDLDIIDFIKEMDVPWRLNVQLHKHLWNPDMKLV